MHVKKDDAIALAQLPAIGTDNIAPDSVDESNRDVARDNRIRHSRQPSMPQMHVRPAHFREDRAQQHAAGFEVGLREFA